MTERWQQDAALKPTPKRGGRDHWPTIDAQVVDGLVHHVLPFLPRGLIWECACGDADLLGDAMRAAGREVISTDLVTGHDFLRHPPAVAHCAAIVTNPPNEGWDEFAIHAHELMGAGVTDSVVLLARWDYLQGNLRGPLLNRAAEIVKCWGRARWIANTKVGPRWSFAWVTWRRDHRGPPITRWLAKSLPLFKPSRSES
jgi:hypothetical protein